MNPIHGLPIVAAWLLTVPALAQDTEPFTSAWLIEQLDRDLPRARAAYAELFEASEARLAARLLAGSRLTDLARATGDEETAQRAIDRRRELIGGRRVAARSPELLREQLAAALLSPDTEALHTEQARAETLAAARAAGELDIVHRGTEQLLRRIDEQRAETIGEVFSELAAARLDGDARRIEVLRRRLAREFFPTRRDVSLREQVRGLRLRYVELLIVGELESARGFRQQISGRQRAYLRPGNPVEDVERAITEVRRRVESESIDRAERLALQRLVEQLEKLIRDEETEDARQILQELPRGMR